jgi:hypothetical protein
MGDVVYLKSTANLSTEALCGCNRYAASEHILAERISRVIGLIFVVWILWQRI